MRISDWSSDVCSSDLRDHARSADRIKQATVDMAWLPHETQVHDTLDIAIRISLRAPDLGGGDKTAVLAGNTDGTSARLPDPAYQFLVDGTGSIVRASCREWVCQYG